jgi:hypothetical protein
MADLIAFPFRVGANGSVVTREQDEPAYYAELLGVMIATRLGERELVPSYGMSDPTFTVLSAQELASKVELFGPPVRILSMVETFVTATEQDVRVEFTPLQAQDEEATFENL